MVCDISFRKPRTIHFICFVHEKDDDEGTADVADDAENKEIDETDEVNASMFIFFHNPRIF